MRILKTLTILSFCMLILSTSGFSETGISPYYKTGSYAGNIADAQAIVVKALEGAGFEIIGQYNPGNNNNLKVVVFTSSKIKEVCLKVKDRGALAAALKVGFKVNGSRVDVSYVNPEYLFNAYFMDEYANHKTVLSEIEKEIKTALKLFDTAPVAFGGSLEIDDVREYQYMFGMEEFTDPVELKEFNSFEEGLALISKNLAAKKGNTLKVYELIYKSEKVAVFGIGLTNKDDGEAFFLPTIGETHVAAMPYEIILQGKEATMLHGRYRIALHWPELTMGTFTKIISTPGYIKDTMEALCE